MHPKLSKRQAQMLESVDKSVSNTDAERRVGSTLALGTGKTAKYLLSVLSCFLFTLSVPNLFPQGFMAQL